MGQFKFEAYLGARFSENLTDKEWKNVYEEIENLSTYYQFTFDGKIIVDKVKFSFAKNAKQITKVKKRFSILTTDTILIIQFNAEEKNFTNNKLSIDYFIEKRLRDLIIAISIAKKGGIEIGGGAKVFINDKLVATFYPFIHSIGQSIERAKKLKWPKIKMIDLKKTILWVENYQNQTDSVSDDKIGRALNAFSYMFNDRGGEGDDGTELFWIMVGLESLYAKGNKDIVTQVNSKSQFFLGQRKEFKKSFQDLYDYRSRLVHGELNFSHKFLLVDNTDKIFNHWMKLYDNQNLAVAVLVASFQKLILSNRTSLDFEMKYKITNLKNAKI